jgi:hypothetical protein
VREFRTLSPPGKPKYKDFDCSIMELADDIAYGVHDHLVSQPPSVRTTLAPVSAIPTAGQGGALWCLA